MMNKEAYNYSINLLSRRDYSKYKLSKKLKEKKFSNEDIDLVIEKLIEQKYLREDEYLRIRTRQLIEKGLSDHLIIRTGIEERIDITLELITSLRSEYERSSDDIIDELVKKKIRYKTYNGFEEKMKLKNKVLRFLISKGHSFDDSNRVLSKYLEGEINTFE